jgi:hypothetical protein
MSWFILCCYNRILETGKFIMNQNILDYGSRGWKVLLIKGPASDEGLLHAPSHGRRKEIRENK